MLKTSAAWQLAATAAATEVGRHARSVKVSALAEEGKATSVGESFIKDANEKKASEVDDKNSVDLTALLEADGEITDTMDERLHAAAALENDFISTPKTWSKYYDAQAKLKNQLNVVQGQVVETWTSSQVPGLTKSQFAPGFDQCVYTNAITDRNWDELERAMKDYKANVNEYKVVNTNIQEVSLDKEYKEYQGLKGKYGKLKKQKHCEEFMLQHGADEVQYLVVTRYQDKDKCSGDCTIS